MFGVASHDNQREVATGYVSNHSFKIYFREIQISLMKKKESVLESLNWPKLNAHIWFPKSKSVMCRIINKTNYFTICHVDKKLKGLAEPPKHGRNLICLYTRKCKAMIVCYKLYLLAHSAICLHGVSNNLSIEARHER